MLGPKRNTSIATPIAVGNDYAPARVLVLHGYGASAEDLVPIGEVIVGQLPFVQAIMLPATEEMPEFPTGRQWFELNTMSAEEVSNGTRQAGAQVVDAIQTAADGKPYMLVGFSQGAMMALHCGLRTAAINANAAVPRGVIGLSGLLAVPEMDSDLDGKTPVLLCHGSEDGVVPCFGSEDATRRLDEAGHATVLHVVEGGDHGIDPETLPLIAAFIENCFADLAPRA